MNGKMLSFIPICKDDVLIGHDFDLILPSFWHNFPGDSVKTFVDNSERTVVEFPEQSIRVPGRRIRTFLRLNEMYCPLTVLSPPVLVFIRGRQGKGTPFTSQIIIDSHPFRFWPPLFTKYQVCPNRWIRYTVLNDDERIKHVEEEYPTSKESRLIQYKDDLSEASL
jgi:hypothetical protein